jgi:hypothetical protein
MLSRRNESRERRHHFHRQEFFFADRLQPPDAERRMPKTAYALHVNNAVAFSHRLGATLVGRKSSRRSEFDHADTRVCPFHRVMAGRLQLSQKKGPQLRPFFILSLRR